MCLIKLLRKIYNPDANKVAPDIDEVDPELEFDAKVKDLGSYTPSRGHKIFSYDFKTRKISEVEFEHVESKGPRGEKIMKRKLKYTPGLLYVSAINLRNAEDHVKKGKFIIPKPAK